MSGGHGHGTATGHAGARYQWRLAVSLTLVAGFFAVELIVGLLSGSLAVLSDAGHLAADVVTLGAALAATRIATRKDTTGRRTFGSYRAEVFASGLAVLVMAGVSVYIAVEAINRIGTHPEVSGTPMLVVGAVGLAINVMGILLLRGGSAESLNVKGAYLEAVADAAGSLGVLAAGVLVSLTGQGWWDTVVALAIGVFVMARAIMLGREVIAVLGQHAPAGMDPNEITAALAAVPGVQQVHDLHLWTLTSGMHVASAHLVTANDAQTHSVLDFARQTLADRFALTHATLQVEPASHTGCEEITW
ncbi:MAG TPA: cation diffusion facilitator family transporter [Actinomycetes bacterium]